MSKAGLPNSEAIKARISEQLRHGQFRFTVHAHQEMVSDNFVMDEVLASLAQGDLLENYPEHQRGACGLFGGATPDGRPIHIVCTTANPVLIVITVYEPKAPKWLTPRPKEIIDMKCSIHGCPGQYEPRAITHTVRQDGQVIVIDHVPAEVCDICGDILLRPETIRQLEALLRLAKPASSAPLYEYASAPAT